LKGVHRPEEKFGGRMCGLVAHILTPICGNLKLFGVGCNSGEGERGERERGR
jgi:hypothetical protein